MPNDSTPPGRNETPLERADRNLAELLQELRVALPGVQVLFAFLLTTPFQQRFGEVTGFQKHVYFVTLILTAFASGLLIAPSAYHRVEFRAGDKEHIVSVANRCALAGFAFLALAMAGAVLLVTDFLFESAHAYITAGLMLGFFLSLWYVAPLRRRMKLERERGARES
jgi:uncharacterized membrane protein